MRSPPCLGEIEKSVIRRNEKTERYGILCGFPPDIAERGLQPVHTFVAYIGATKRAAKCLACLAGADNGLNTDRDVLGLLFSGHHEAAQAKPMKLQAIRMARITARVILVLR